jgi:hypothetical protein
MSLLGKKRDEQAAWPEDVRDDEEPEERAQTLPPPPLVTVGPRMGDADRHRPTEHGAPDNEER